MVDAVLAPGWPVTASDAARDYLRNGISIVPIKGDGSKSPTIGWTALQRDRMPVDQVGFHFIANNVGVGIICGAVSGHLEVIDFDLEELFAPFAAEVERQRPGLMATLTVHKTPEQGFHLIYRSENPVDGNQKLARHPNPDDPKKPKTTIETRGEGGYVVAPGSPACCHKKRKPYTHHSGPPVTTPTVISEADRQLLFRIAASFEEVIDEPRSHQPPPSPGFSGLTPGDDFNARAQWEDLLLPEGWVLDHSCGDKQYWRRPGKDAGWSATLGLKSANGNELFCCFTDNAHPLRGADGRSPCTPYSKFALYATFHHNGDFSAAASRLRTEGYGDQPPPRTFDGGDRFTNGSAATERKPPPPEPAPLERIGLGRLIDEYPTLNEPVIEGLLRRLEVMNIIAAPKVGKSWFLYYLLLCIATGQPIFGRYPVKQGRVLLVDLELHKSLIASRLKTVARSMDLEYEDYADMVDVVALRGNWRSIRELLVAAGDIEYGEYVVIAIDSRYRLNTDASDENANGESTALYNDLDRFGELTGSAIIVIAHSSKGDQSGKRITDIGAGAGAQSRAADCHAAIREHEEAGTFVLDAVVRSFAPFEPLAIRWDFPMWSADDEADPAQLKGLHQPKETKKQIDDIMKCDQMMAALRAAPRTPRELRAIAGVSKDRLDTLIAKLELDGRITGVPHVKNHNNTTLYSVSEFEAAREFEGVVDF